MCGDHVPAVFQYFTKVSSLPSNFLFFLILVCFTLCDAFFPLQEAFCEEESGTLDPKDPNRPRFTLQELRDVLHERNELKAKVFLLQEELAYYKRYKNVPNKADRTQQKLDFTDWIVTKTSQKIIPKVRNKTLFVLKPTVDVFLHLKLVIVRSLQVSS